MPEKSALVHIRFSFKDLQAIDEAVFLSNQKSRHRPHTRSSWVRQAVGFVLQLEKAKRRKAGGNKLTCATCKRKIAMGEVSYSVGLLTGGTEYYCSKCDKRNPVD